MINLTEFKLDKWKPDFTDSGQSSPDWTKVFKEIDVFCNSLEWTEWDNNPVQLILCEHCGHSECETGGYVTISRLNDFLIITNPERDINDSYDISQFTPHILLRKYGTIIIERKTWDQWKKDYSLPDFSVFPPLRKRDLLDSWLLEHYKIKGIESFSILFEYLNSDLLTSDNYDKYDVVKKLKEKIVIYSDRLKDDFCGELIENQLQTERLYFNGPKDLDWPCFTEIDGDLFLTISDKYYFKDKKTGA